MIYQITSGECSYCSCDRQHNILEHNNPSIDLRELEFEFWDQHKYDRRRSDYHWHGDFIGWLIQNKGFKYHHSLVYKMRRLD
jgi:hypothetical protein